MPGRMIREGYLERYLESARVASLGPLAERFYFHLLLAVNDDGICDADPLLLKNRCFPAREDIRTADVPRWIAECEKAGLVRLSEISGTGKREIEVLRHERAISRGNREKPIPADDSASCFPFAAFWNSYGKKVERKKCMEKYARIGEADRAVIRAKLPGYIAATPDVQFRKNPQTWLNGRCWEDELPAPGAGHAPRGGKGF